MMTPNHHFVPLPAALFLAAAAALAAPDRAPNIVVIVTDDMGYADLGCYGGTDIPTPNIDRLAASGVRFTAGYVTASVCCPSRAAIMTGRYQQRFGHEFNGPSKPDYGYAHEDLGLALEERTLADALRAAGYRTLAVGKWHLGEQPQFHPLERGFDDFFGFLGGGRTYYGKPGGVTAGARMRCGAATVRERGINYTTDDFTDQAVAFIEVSDEQPFFVYLAYNAVHTPMEVRPTDLPKILELPEGLRRAYYGMMIALDDGVGAVVDALERRGVRDDTLLILINDNGGATNNASDNGPLRGMKGSKWEGGVRVPYMISWPRRIPAGLTFDKPVSALDIFPTCVTAAGGTLHAGHPLDGVDLLPYITGNNPGTPHDVLYWRRGSAAAIRDGRWKLIRSDGNPILLFNLDEDLGETQNLADAQPSIVSRLLARLADWEKELALPRWCEAGNWEINQQLKHRMEVIGREEERELP